MGDAQNRCLLWGPRVCANGAYLNTVCLQFISLIFLWTSFVFLLYVVMFILLKVKGWWYSDLAQLRLLIETPVTQTQAHEIQLC